MAKKDELPPNELSPLEITICNQTRYGDLVFKGYEVHFADGLWRIKIYITEPGLQLRLATGDSKNRLALAGREKPRTPA